MAEYIEREAAIAAIMSEPPDAHYPHWYADKIKSIPAANVATVRHGRRPSTRELVTDAEAIDKMLQELAIALQELEEV